jgi:hypothetical protein
MSYARLHQDSGVTMFITIATQSLRKLMFRKRAHEVMSVMNTDSWRSVDIRSRSVCFSLRRQDL